VNDEHSANIESQSLKSTSETTAFAYMVATVHGSKFKKKSIVV